MTAPEPICTTCGLQKKPIGRDAPLALANSLCDYECRGYLEAPKPGTLWPGETDTMPLSEFVEKLKAEAPDA